MIHLSLQTSSHTDRATILKARMIKYAFRRDTDACVNFSIKAFTIWNQQSTYCKPSSLHAFADASNLWIITSGLYSFTLEQPVTIRYPRFPGKAKYLYGCWQSALPQGTFSKIDLIAKNILCIFTVHYCEGCRTAKSIFVCWRWPSLHKHDDHVFFLL